MVGDRIREARELVGLSARELSRLAGLSSEGHVGQLELGDVASARITTIAAIAEVLGVSIDWLVTGRGRPPTRASARASVLRARARPRRRAS